MQLRRLLFHLLYKCFAPFSFYQTSSLFLSHLYVYHFMMRLLRWKETPRHNVVFSPISLAHQVFWTFLCLHWCVSHESLFSPVASVYVSGISMRAPSESIIRFVFSLPTSVSTCLHVYLRALKWNIRDGTDSKDGKREEELRKKMMMQFLLSK